MLVWLGGYGAATPKPVYLWGNRADIETLWIQKPKMTVAKEDEAAKLWHVLYDIRLPNRMTFKSDMGTLIGISFDES